MPSFWAKHLGFPDPLDNPVKWNEGWEQLLSSNKIDIRKHVAFSTTALPAGDREAFFSNHRDRTADLCRLQHDLTLNTTAIFATKDFENAWLCSSAQDRRAHLLEGLVRACLDNSQEDGRLYSEELTLSNMEKGNGRAFLTLLKFFMLHDTSSLPNEPIFLPSAKWKYDKPLSTGNHSEDMEEVAFATFRLSRSIFICEFFFVSQLSLRLISDQRLTLEGQFLWNTVASFMHVPRQRTQKPKPSHRDKIGQAFSQYIRTVFGPDFAEEMKRDHASRIKDRVAVCQHCTKSEKDLKFMVCAPCKNLQNRRIFYCSK
jgi:hypothetical protein